MKTVARMSALFVVALALYDCASKGSEPAHLVGIDHPEWVVSGSGVLGGDEKVFSGVGSVNGIKNAALARTTAANRARNEIAKVFNVYSASLMKDYMASTTAGDMEASSEEQHVEQAIKTFVAEELSGIEITEYWFHPDGDTIYALAQMDLSKFTDAFSRMKELSAQVRDYVRKNAERVHMDLEKEEEKRTSP
jgi:hypothetical protein